MGRIVSLLGREHEAAVIELLAASQVHRPAEEAAERAPAIASEYASRESFALWGYEDGAGQIIGLAGVEWSEEGHMRLADLAVAADARRRGIGRALVDHLRYVLQPRGLAGFTLAAVVPFYEATGFDVAPFGTMPSGEPRFSFRWRLERS